MTIHKKRYAQVGIGGRSMMYSTAVVETYRENSELVSLCDNNPGRLRQRAEWAYDRGVKLETYSDTQFDQMVAETKPDILIVTTPDYLHEKYICRAMELGVDVITEKAMTTDETRCQHILDTCRLTGRICRVTFNYRYSPPSTQVKDLLMSGVIGDVLSVDFHWMLNTSHGADYFRRWHRRKANSGGLQVHKATHHFDLVNWWLSSVPETVHATGGRFFYTPVTADRYGLCKRADRCLVCPEKDGCPFFLDLRAHPGIAEMYLQNEQYDGYYRDRCVFGAEIDIEDTLHVMVGYHSGVQMSYSLIAYSPWEGYIVSFTGSKGRLEHTCQETVYISGDGKVPGELIEDATRTRIIPHFQPGYNVEIWRGEGGHGGGDPVLLEQLFSPKPPADPYRRAADERGGAWSILVGAAINRSLERAARCRSTSWSAGCKYPIIRQCPRRQSRSTLLRS